MKHKIHHSESRTPRRIIRPVKNKKRLFMASISMISILIIVGYYQWQNSSNKNSSRNQTTYVPISAPKFQPPTEEFAKTLYNADQLLIKSDYDGSIKLLENALSKTTDQSHLYTLQSKLGYSYKAKGDWQAAVKWFEQAQTNSPPNANGLYLEIAEAAEKANDKPKAIAAYKRVIEQLQSNPSPVAKKNAEMYQAKITSLGGL